MSVVLQTNLGDIVVDLLIQDAPKNCANFLKLCKMNYYRGHVIHTVLSDSLFQTGDPSGTGKGGVSIYDAVNNQSQSLLIPHEIHPTRKFSKSGLVSMAGMGQKGNCSQFFVTTTNRHLSHLDGKHTIIGTVEEGMNVVDIINDSLCDEKHRPFTDIIILNTIILEDPFPDMVAIPNPIKKISNQVRSSHRILPSNIDPDTLVIKKDQKQSNIPAIETEEEKKRKEAYGRALTLEMIGDLPNADVAPPENVLFVCKLNPITTDEDLELIFSRFGAIRSCEIIRDHNTGDSLQYAFIEFKDKSSCEQAYKKMENVLIDDRRIHVDFSQSVSKMHKDWKVNRKRKLESHQDSNDE